MHNEVRELPIQTYNLANGSKWVFNLPLARLFNLINNVDHKNNDQYLDFPLNCKAVQFPDFKLGTTKVSFLNYSFDVSTRQNLTEKQLTITFALSENWLQYLVLLKWFELCDFSRYTHKREDTIEIDVGKGVRPTILKSSLMDWEIKTGKHPYYSTQGPVVNCNLFLMDNFMNRICTFNFEGCFITGLKNIELDYAKTESTEITTQLTMSFYKYNYIVNDKKIKNFIPQHGINMDDHDILLEGITKK